MSKERTVIRLEGVQVASTATVPRKGPGPVPLFLTVQEADGLVHEAAVPVTAAIRDSDPERSAPRIFPHCEECGVMLNQKGECFVCEERARKVRERRRMDELARTLAERGVHILAEGPIRISVDGKIVFDSGYAIGLNTFPRSGS